MNSMQTLIKQRQQIETLREKISLSTVQAKQLGQHILKSWQRSKLAEIPKERMVAPLITTSTVESNSLNQALKICEQELKHVAQQSSMVLAVGDINSTIIWTEASQQMRKAAERVHFIEGGQWREEVVGTNALALTLKTEKSSCVFSNEHYMESIHDWVCYAAPIVDPFSKQLIGVLDLSTTWDHHNSFGLLAAERCASLIQSALLNYQRQHLFIRTFGIPQVIFNGRTLVVTPRQIEILTILALCPQGLSLDSLHQALYGERKVSMGTLKAEMSQLRDLLGGMLGSRPYKLLAHIEADFLQIENALDVGFVDKALQQVNGVMLAKTESPFLCSWRNCLDSRLSEAIFNYCDVEVLLKYIARNPDAVDAMERLMELSPQVHSTQQLLQHYHN
ncbi:transcriptional regulator [Acinetobacter sp. Ver3]|uniref:transcriptional regulator n=1 Tax=Acinetobacter sp. Ver3 TaxID=466088 RepID=UPI00044C9820|nr:transcriptional regulator [Acinetobacter sp. Ver3]EZQ12495.1 transcriptional regulator [Acinetobacter sp. Ver3]